MNASVVAGTAPANRDQMPMNPPLAYSIAQACEIANISRTSVYDAIKSRKLIARKNGRRTVILAEDLRLWLQDLPARTPQATSKPQSIADIRLPESPSLGSPHPRSRQRAPFRSKKKIPAPLAAAPGNREIYNETDTSIRFSLQRLNCLFASSWPLAPRSRSCRFRLLWPLQSCVARHRPLGLS